MAKTDEETVQSQDTSAKAETTQTEEVQGEEVEQEPTPYKNAYHKDLDKDDPEPEVKTEEEEQSEQSFMKDTKPIVHDFKKRYDDLKSHYDRKLNEWKQEKETLHAQSKATQSGIANLKSSEELDKFKEEYPDVYGVVETVASKQANERVSNLETEVKSLKEKEQELKMQNASQELLSVHPDFPDFKESEEFNAWLQEQPTNISDGILKNGVDAKWAVRVLDLYKSDAGKASTTSKPDLKSAAQAVTKTKPVQYSAKAGNKKIWNQSEISKLKPQEFENLEKELDLAAKEGRISSE
jgi:uncharacterized protein YutD